MSDNRLDNLVESYYRIWNDNCRILVPKGQTLTNPLQPQQVDVNVRVYGKITKNFFHSPTVEFTNTFHSAEIFDTYKLSTFRGDLDENVDWVKDLALNFVVLRAKTVFTGYTLKTVSSGDYILYWTGTSWESLPAFAGNLDSTIYVRYRYSTEFLEDTLILPTDIVINGKPLYICVYRAELNMNNSSTSLTESQQFRLGVSDESEYQIIGGGSNGK